MFDCKTKELLNIQAWIIREGFLKEMNLFVIESTLRLKGAERAKKGGRGPGKRLLLEPSEFMVA